MNKAAAALGDRDPGFRWGDKGEQGKQQPEVKRLAILRTAAQLFNERGFYASSLNELAQRLNITKPSLYYYVQNKDDILLQILQLAMEEINPAIEESYQGAADGLGMLRIFVGKYARVVLGDFGKCLVLCGTGPLEQGSRDRLAPSYRRIDHAVRDLVAKGIADGSIRPCDPKIASFALFGALHWMTSWYRAETGLTPDELGALMFQIFEKGLAGAPAGGPHQA